MIKGKPKGHLHKLLAIAVSVTSAISLCAIPALADTTPTAASVQSMSVATNHQGTNTNGTDDQFVDLNITFDRQIQIKDSSALVKELNVTLGGTDLTATTYPSEQAVSSDGKTLKLVFHFPFAAYDSSLKVSSTNQSGPELASVVDTASGLPVNFPAINIIVGNGISFSTASQTVGTSSSAASVQKTVTLPASATRAMFHVVLLKNGAPVGTVDSYNANITSHFHMYLPNGSNPAYTSTDVAKNLASAISSSFNNAYTATSNGGDLTITEVAPVAGDVLDLLFIGYPRTGNNKADTTALNATIAKAKAANLSDYTSDNAAALQNQLVIAQSYVGSTYYLQTEVDAETQTLSIALAATIPTSSSSATSSASSNGASSSITSSVTSSATSSTSSTGTVENPKTGVTSASPMGEVTVFFVGAVACGAVLFHKKRKK